MNKAGLREAIANALWKLTSNYEQQGTPFESVPDGVKQGFYRKADYLINEVGAAHESWDDSPCSHQWVKVGLYEAGLKVVCPTCETSKTCAL